MSQYGNHSPPLNRSVFTGYRFPPEVIMFGVRWYLRYGPSYGDVEELLDQRSIEADHATMR
jgi:IS6 family transposase